MGYLGNVKKQYLITFFQSLIPAYVIERLFWQARGMNVQMVVFCEIIYAITVILLEIPSGVLSDRFGRKRLLVINGALSAVEFLIVLFANNFWMFAAAVFLSGIGKALSSGSENALLYDSLLAENKQNSFEKVLGRLMAVDYTGTLIAAFCGSVAAHYFGFEFNYIISFFSMFIAFLLSFSLKEPPRVTNVENEWGALRHMKSVFVVFQKNPLVLLYTISGAILGGCLIYLDEFRQLILDGIGIPVIFFGVVSALEFLFRAPGGLLAYKLKKRFSYRRILFFVIAINAIGYTVLCFTKNILCLIPIVLVSLSMGVCEPLISGYLHHHTESGIRATVESFASLGLRLFSMLVGLIFGYVSTKFDIFAGFLVLGIVCFCYLLYFTMRSNSISDNKG